MAQIFCSIRRLVEDFVLDVARRLVAENIYLLGIF